MHSRTAALIALEATTPNENKYGVQAGGTAMNFATKGYA
jgi:hypothetical protein